MKHKVLNIKWVLAVVLVLLLALAGTAGAEDPVYTADGSDFLPEPHLTTQLAPPVDCSTDTGDIVAWDVSNGGTTVDHSKLIADLQAKGFTIRTVNIATDGIPACIKKLVITTQALNSCLFAVYTPAQVSLIVNAVDAGLGLFLLNEWGPYCGPGTAPIANALQATWNGTGAHYTFLANTHYDPNNPATLFNGVGSWREFYASDYTTNQGVVVTTGVGKPAMIAKEFGQGCTVIAGDSNWIADNWIDYNNNRTLASNALVYLNECGNQPPTADPNGPYTGSEGSPVDFDGTGSSDPDGDTLAFDWDFGDSSTGTGPTPSHIYIDNFTSYSVCLTVTDPGGLSDMQCTTADIANVDPDVGPISVSEELIQVGTSIDASAVFTDPATADTHTAVWEWDDGTSDTIDPAISPTSASHTYDTPDVCTVKVTVTDDDGGSDMYIYEFVVVYDPSAGSVTGGGWIDSPEGAYKPDESLSGKATFGFVSKYKKGADTPTGNTEFQFHAASLNFHSDTYEWLVVTGSNYARFKGVGTINGEGAYKFMLWAGDDEPDTFRIRIWVEDEVTAVETDIYDNGFDQPIGGGSIVIHTGK